MQYLAWRVLSGLNKRTEISFMVVGHTKFAPDWCFGLVKQKFRRTKIGCLEDIARVVNTSAVVNHAQLVGKEDGTVIVPQYNWADFFAPCFRRQAFKGIKSLHHLVFSSTQPGYAMVRESTDSTEWKLPLLSKDYRNWTPSPTDLPPIIQPEGLSHERKQYLFDKIREFCPPHCRDIVCPDPSPSITTSLPSTNRTRTESQSPDPDDVPPSPKRRH